MYLAYLNAGLAGDIRPVGVWGRELDLTGNFLEADNADIPWPATGVFLGILDGVASSNSKNKYKLKLIE